MKKLFLSLCLVAVASSAFSQDMTSKKGTPILPEANDWSVGISANPFLSYFGNLLNGNTNNSSPGWNFLDTNMVITGKMMKDESTAYRAKIRIGFGSSTITAAPDTTSGSLKETKTSGMHINLGAGIQKYRGKGRLKGYYGAEIGFGIGSGSTGWTYNGTPATGTPTKVENGSTFDLNLNGFLGAEYFFAPKMSLSGEFTWGLMMSSTGEGTASSTGSPDVKTGSSSSFGIDTDNAGGSINLNLYF